MPATAGREGTANMVVHKIVDWDNAYTNGANIAGGDRWPAAWVAPAAAYRDELAASGRA